MIRFNYKRSSQQVSFSRSNFFYKHYHSSIFSFDHLVRRCLYKVYRELGLDFEYSEKKYFGKYIEICKKPICEVAPLNESPKILFSSFRPVLKLVESKLSFRIIESQLRELIPNFDHLKLGMSQFPVGKDYFKYKDNYYLLDDEGFVVSLFDENDKLLTFKADDYFVVEYPLNGELVPLVILSKLMSEVEFRDPFKLSTPEVRFIASFDVGAIDLIKSLQSKELGRYKELVESCL